MQELDLEKIRQEIDKVDQQLADVPAETYADRSWPATHDGYRRLLVHKTLQLRNVSR